MVKYSPFLRVMLTMQIKVRIILILRIYSRQILASLSDIKNSTGTDTGRVREQEDLIL